MTTPECSACDRPVADNAYLCQTCTGDLEKLLGDVPALIGDLAVTYTMSSRTTDRSNGSKSAETSLPWSDKASEALDGLTNCLTTWVRLIVEERGENGDPEPHDDLLSISRWLLRHVGWLRHHQAASEALRDVERAVNAVNRVMDLAAERWYAGKCSAETDHGPVCGVDLYAKTGALKVSCWRCRAVYDVADRRKWLLDQCEDVLAHSELIGRALASLGEAVTPAAIRGYALRGRIVAHGLDREGRQTYRIGDVRQVVREIEARKAARSTKMSA